MKVAYSYIRFSTPEQQMGDSERRQLALAKAYCEREKLKLSEEGFTDKGVSAYHGKNHQNGALGRLLRLVRPGDVILIEDSDRWSREDPLDALLRLRTEVQRGIEIVFLRTGVRVTKDNFSDPSVLYPNFFGAVVGNAENKKKAERIAAVWQAKREQASQGKAVRLNRLPCWLEWDEKVDKPVVNEAKAKIVRRLFRLACEGHLVLDICRRLQGTAPITRGGKRLKPVWNPTSVRRILTDKAVLGYYCQSEPPTPGVWPAILDETRFCIAQTKLDFVARSSKRPGKSEVNLFTGLLRCGRCGSSLLAHVNRKPPEGRPRLVCGGAMKGSSDCRFASAPLALIEKSFLSFLGDSDLIRPLLTERSSKPSKLDELQSRLAEADKQVAKLTHLIMGDDEPSPTLYTALKAQEAKAKTLRSEIEAEHVRVKGESPVLEAYDEFCQRLPALAADKSQRPALRRAIGTVTDHIMLDPRGNGNGTWDYSVQLKGGSEPISVRCVAQPEGWLYRSLRPAKYVRPGGNIIG